MKDLFALFSWLPAPLDVLCIGGLGLFLLIGLFRLIRAVIEFVLNLIPGW